MVYVWALEQEDTTRRKFTEQDVLVPWCVPPSKEEQRKGKGMVVYNRYCHLFVKDELPALSQEIGG